MKKILFFIIICAVSASVWAAESTPDRRSMAQQWGAAPRATASKNQISMTAATVEKSSIKAETPSASITVDRREKEKAACINNNIGVGNTFVWASKYSNTNNYSSMVEDVAEPANNVCFVRVELKSSDSKVSVSDIPAVYYEMGRTITCGAWADSKKLEDRILAAKKSARTWGTVAGVVGGAGVGVGAMELFGNKLIGGSVEGQKDLVKNDKDGYLRSQLLIYKTENPDEYGRFRAQMQALSDECEKDLWKADGAVRPSECDQFNYNAFMAL
ncbi:MAG: hypothetical protein LBJ73_01260 [Rickettsiales bacterium]|nr:hypothetical protein [Rickettsiales bacterium]